MYNKLPFILVLTYVCQVSLVSLEINADETDIEKKLFEEIVKIVDGKMVSTEYGLLSFPAVSNEKRQIKLYAEVPAEGVISRDNFVAITTMLQTMILLQMAAEAHSQFAIASTEFLENLDESFEFEELDEPIGRVDLEFNFYMNKGGLQIEIVNTINGSTNRSTVTWNEMFD